MLDCPEEIVMGIVWERSLTNATYNHKCSDIHPSFKLADVVTRKCMKNRSWTPVDMSQCVMDLNSPVVMVLVVTLNAENSSIVQSAMDQINNEVCILLKVYVLPGLTKGTYSLFNCVALHAYNFITV